MTRFSSRELDGLAPHERRSMEAFGSLEPGIVAHPHLLVAHGLDAVSAVRASVEPNLGIWGEVPLVDASGQTFDEPEDGNLSQLFRVWEHPANRAEVDRYAVSRRNTTVFSMLIATATPESQLDVMYKEALETNLSAYYHYMIRVIAWLPALEFAYIPLQPDNELAMLVVYGERSSSIARARQAMRERGLSPFELKQTNGPLLWPLGT